VGTSRRSGHIMTIRKDRSFEDGVSCGFDAQVDSCWDRRVISRGLDVNMIAFRYGPSESLCVIILAAFRRLRTAKINQVRKSDASRQPFPVQVFKILSIEMERRGLRAA
jgi:hypothetical protein